MDTALDDLYRVTLGRRNVGPGHGGVVGEQEFQRRLERRLPRLSTHARWSRAQARGRLPSERPRAEGSSQTFVEIEVDTLEPMDDGALYLLDPDTRLPLPIVPFLQIRPGPRTAANACYFFNAIEDDRQVRLVSYHFEQEATIEALEPDLVELVESLSRRR